MSPDSRHKIRDQRDIVDRKALTAKLERLTDRSAVLALFKEMLEEGRKEVRRRFEEEGESGTECVRSNSFLMDQIIRMIHDYAARVEEEGGAEGLSILAVGGYGRGELSPFSDIDLLFLLPGKATKASERVVETMLYLLWDLGLKVGHSTRSIDECLAQAKGDMTIRTAMLEARWLWGDKALASDLMRRLRKELIAGTGVEFVEAKLEERDGRHERMGESRYVLEPNLKEGKGGLRDLHTLFWIAKYLYGVSDMDELVELGVLNADAAQRFAKAQNFLWTVRCHLHYITGRLEDRLTFDVQQEIAARVDYTDRASSRGVERFMRHYFLVAKDVGDLTRIICAVLEENHKRKPKLSIAALARRKRGIGAFEAKGGRLNVVADDTFEKDPLDLLRLFHTAHEHRLDIHPHALHLVQKNLKRVAKLRRSKEANKLFMDLLASDRDPETALRWLNDSGVLGEFVPDFAKVVAQMQYDMYHVYTTDEHTIRAIGLLHRIEQGKLAEDHPVSSEVVHKVQSRQALYVALFLHDIAKGRHGDHSELGAVVAEKLGPRLGLSAEEVETASWLVRHHLLMSHFAFKRDIDDPKTIKDFANAVQSPERLRLLLVLTVADIRAVGPKVWNGWKANLLRALYYRTEEVLTGTPTVHARDVRVQAAKDTLAQRLTDWTAKEIRAYLPLGYPPYWLGFDASTHEHHARLIRRAKEAGKDLYIETRADPAHAVTEVIIHTADHPGLFSHIAGALALAGASIVEARIVTLANGMALDTFVVQDLEGQEISGTDRLAALQRRLEETLTKSARLGQLLKKRPSAFPSRAGVFTVPPRALIDNTASETHTVIEINARDRAGLLYDVTSELTRLSLQISSARIATYGERAVDVFYVKDIFGMKVSNDHKLKQIRERLLAVLEEKG